MRDMKYLDHWFRIAPDLLSCMWKSYEDTDVCPAKENVFRSLEYFWPDETQVVILGQDPYHTPGKASGLAFGYHDEYVGNLDSSLHNIVQELLSEGFDVPGYSDANYGTQKREWFTLERWARQGVLLLNTRLTVRAGLPLSHSHIGWQGQVEILLKWLAENTDTLYMCWGSHARDLVRRSLLETGKLGEDRAIYTSHPCKFSHMRGSSLTPAFSGRGCFGKINELLKQKGKEEIIW